MIKRLPIVVILLTLPVLLNACVWGRQKINVEGFHEKAELVVAGETKADELSGILGSPPNAILPLKEGKKLYVYTFGDGKTEAFNLRGFDLQVVDQVPIVPPVNEHNQRYLETKRAKMGHQLPEL